jgi:hypothetical protein
MEIKTHSVSLKYYQMGKKDTLDILTQLYFAMSIMIKTYSNGILHFLLNSFKMGLAFNLNHVTTVGII